ncbi:MAG: pilus assembly protein N-terminal domain-containing protein [Bacillota bacterium]
MNLSSRRYLCILVATTVVLAAASPGLAQEVGGSASDQTFALVAGQSRLLQVNGLVRVAVADPAVADVVVVSKTEVIVNGKSEGRTTLHIWDSSGHTGLDVRVYKVDSRSEPPKSEPPETDPDVALRDAIIAAVRDPGVQVTVVKGAVLLEGEVSSDYEKLRAETIARLYASNVASVIRVAEAAPPPVPAPAPQSPSPPQPAEPRLEDTVAEYIGIPTVRVRSAGGKLLLEGSVKSQNDLERAQKIAGMFSADVVNLLEMTDPVQVLLKVQVVEVNLGSLKNLGVTWGAVTGEGVKPGMLVFGEAPIPITPPLLPDTPQAQNWQMRLPVDSIVTEIWRLSPIRATLDWLISQDAARVLAAPSLLTLSGKQASFLVGGEIPVYLGRSDGKITFEWRPYGVKLNILPTVDSRGRVMIDVEPEVSSLDWNNALDVGDAVIPALKVRKASTHLVVADGATIALGGLLQRSEVEGVKKLPILGDLPIIGALFRSKKFEQGETELVIFITPAIARAGEQVSREMILELAPPGASEVRGQGREK